MNRCSTCSQVYVWLFCDHTTRLSPSPRKSRHTPVTIRPVFLQGVQCDDSKSVSTWAHGQVHIVLNTAGVQTHNVRVARCDALCLCSLTRRSIQVLVLTPVRHGFQSVARSGGGPSVLTTCSIHHGSSNTSVTARLSRAPLREMSRPFFLKKKNTTNLR